MPFDLLPPPSLTKEQEWTTYLNQTQPSSHDLNPYRFGFYTHQHRQQGIRRAVPVPHPQSREYSSIETAKRKRAQADWWANRKRQIHHEDIQHQRWIRPMSESQFQVHRPNIQNFNRVLKLRLPRGYD